MESSSSEATVAAGVAATGPNSTSLPWFAVIVRVRFENKVKQSLEGRGAPSFVPARIVKRKWSDRVKTMEDPLFPGYVFARFEPECRLPILTTPGVMGIVSFGQQPAPIDEEEIDAIRTAVSNGNCQPWPYIAAGQMVRVTSGPLQGIEGVLAADKNSWQVVLSVSTLRRSIAVTVPKDMIEPVTPAQRGTAASLHAR